jgi:hypothetical protein
MTEVVEKICTKCGQDLPIANFYTTGKKVSGTPKYNSWCKPCVANKQASYHKRTWGPMRLQFSAQKRTKNVRSFLSYLRQKATQRRKDGDIVSLDALETLWFAQQGKCALTGWPMTMELGNGVVQTNCSIDRIDSDKGYVVGNVQLVCRIANIAKSSLTTSDFANLCKAVVTKHGL